MYPRQSILALSALVLLLALSATGEDTPKKKLDPAYRKSVAKYLTIQNVPSTLEEQMTYVVADQMIGFVAANGVEITDPVQGIVLSETRKQIGTRFGDIEFLTDVYAPIYAEHFSEKELQELIDFLESPIGQKTIELTPMLAQSTQMAVQMATQELLPELQKKLKERLTGAGHTPTH
jgi:hypothetical protein